MAAVIDVKNPIEVRRAALRVLNEQLGPDVTQAFIQQYEGTGNFTEERHLIPEPDTQELIARIRKASAEIQARKTA